MHNTGKGQPMPATPEPIPHGTPDYSELRALGLRVEELTLFSSNINPFGPPPAVVDALRQTMSADAVARYPDRLSLELRDLLAAYHGVSADSMLVGNGSADLLWLVGLLYLRQRHVAILGPTFGEYRNVAQIMQAQITEVAHPGWVVTPNGFTPGESTVNDAAATLRKIIPEVVFVCNPNNPTGHYLAPDDLLSLYEAAPHALWIIDEAYAEFMQPPATTSHWVDRGNWLVVRSMTKDFALGGLRLGYLLGTPALIAPLQNIQPPWNVNALAQLAGSVSLREGQPWRGETLARLRHETTLLQQQLQGLGYRPHPTTVSFFLVPVASASELRNALLAHRLVVRDCTSFGLPTYIRLATQLPTHNARLLRALRQVTPLSVSGT
jgi:histidinol-phosphate aminotransferase